MLKMRPKMKDVLKYSKRQSLAQRFLEILLWSQWLLWVCSFDYFSFFKRLFPAFALFILERKYCNSVRITLQDEDELSGGDTFQLRLQTYFLTELKIKVFN